MIAVRKNVHVPTVVIPELELCHIERQILFADLVEGADYAALEDAPARGIGASGHLFPCGDAQPFGWLAVIA